MALEIVLDPEQPHFSQTTALDGVDFQFVFRFNEREQRFYMDLSDADGQPILMGVKLVADWPPLRYLVDPRRPAGELYVFDTEGTGDAPSLGDLGRRTKLIYLTAEELGR